MITVLALGWIGAGCALDPSTIGDETETRAATGGGSQGGVTVGSTETLGGSGVATTAPGGTSAGSMGGSGSGSDGSGAEPTGGGPTSGGIDPPMTCEELLAAFAAETTLIRSCDLPEQCGQVLLGTSCGCTRDWVARSDADLTQWEALVQQGNEMECGLPFGSSCDCPEADGFTCDTGECSWNYVAT
ncbi:MAG: hypothetical protein K0V04_12435 [Deltaproteobacteria bacterium]|nr:hypothetical protein [Deltaproteobacteria bacterium]